NRNAKPPQDGVDLFIISNGVHTDICFALDDANLNWGNILDWNNFKTNKAAMKYLSIGWGDKGFYFDTPSWAELSAKTALRAAFIPSPTAMHISILQKRPIVGEMIRKTKVTKAQLQKIEKYIFKHLQTKNQKATLIDCCRYEGFDDNFYEANGAYHLFRTCNVWANKALKIGGVRTATWAPFDKCILYHFPIKN
ncbi:MAG TPA: TIGR02117 family protein, partial [Phaeodactylibacter sp.]|nr:TIGR02117 family protein [Phaeodactylibacter sp.]